MAVRFGRPFIFEEAFYSRTKGKSSVLSYAGTGAMAAHIIVFGNEKGGSGKTTNCTHIATALLRAGHSVGVLDLDLRQKSTTRFFENRARFAKKSNLDLGLPEITTLPDADPNQLNPGENIYDRRLSEAIGRMEGRYEYIVIDCPGSHTRLSQVAHSLADTLITPLNDSFIDFDLLARIDPETQRILGPAVYSQMVWQARQLRAQAGLQPIDWIVVRNRVGTQRMHNKKKITDAVDALAKRIGFRVAPGFSERVIFRELFLRGLTLLDLGDVGVKNLNISNIAARQELRELLKEVNIPGFDVDF